MGDGSDPLEAFATDCIREGQRVRERILEGDFPRRIAELVRRSLAALEAGGKILLFGNGGSNTDAQHIAGEIVCRMRTHRRALPAMSLGLSTSQLTAVGNDIGFHAIFEREVEAFAGERDVVIGLSTSGASENVLRGVAAARERGAFTAALAGKGGGALAGGVDLALVVDSDDTARIQEVHIVVGHILADAVEKHFLDPDKRIWDPRP